MNHVYKTVWNEVSGTYVAVSEITKGRGKRSGSAKAAVAGIALMLGGLVGGTVSANTIPDHFLSIKGGSASNINYNNDGATGNHSMAIGIGAQAQGNYSSAVGYLSLAEGEYSGAFGASAQAQGNYSSAVGQLSLAKGSSSGAFGREAQALGDRSSAVGYLSLAEGASSGAFGREAQARGINSSAVGSRSLAEGDYSGAFGAFAQATAVNAMAIGTSAVASAVNSIAFGSSANAAHANSVALGANSATQNVVKTERVTIDDEDYDFVGIAPVGTVSVGNLGKERTITNVAAGRIESDSTDAINGSQLFATNQAIDTLASKSLTFVDDYGTLYERKLGEAVTLVGGLLRRLI